jgi:hypothetical protein
MCGASAHVSLAPSPKEARSGHISTDHKFLFICDRFVTRSTLRLSHDTEINGTRRGLWFLCVDIPRRTTGLSSWGSRGGRDRGEEFFQDDGGPVEEIEPSPNPLQRGQERDRR